MATRIGQRRKAHLYIDEWFEFRGLNDERVGERLGIDRTTVWKWRKNPSRLDPSKMDALAEALDIETPQLYRPPNVPSLDSIVKDYPDDLKQKAAEIVRLLGKTG
jgi:transcriptional regulator with XRE-family HTH domain